MEISRHWRFKAQRYRLEGTACPICGQFGFPPRPACPRRNAQPARIAPCELSAIPASKLTVNAVPSKG